MSIFKKSKRKKRQRQPDIPQDFQIRCKLIGQGLYEAFLKDVAVDVGSKPPQNLTQVLQHVHVTAKVLVDYIAVATAQIGDLTERLEALEKKSE